jgi:hypothetical protein
LRASSPVLAENDANVENGRIKVFVVKMNRFM